MYSITFFLEFVHNCIFIINVIFIYSQKIVIVQRKLQAKSTGILSTPQDGSDLDVEVREIKNPFLRARCNFAVRYVVPNRVNIIRIMEANNRFKSEVDFLSSIE